MHNSASPSYQTDRRRRKHPAEFPPAHGIVSNHVLNSIVESLNAKAPRDGDALEEDEEEQTPAADSVRVENLEHVHAALRDAAEANNVADDTNNGDEDLFAATKQFGPFVNHRCDEALHCAELRVETDE